MPKTLYFIVILTLMSFHSSVFAQEGSWYLTPAIIYFDDDPDRALDDGIAGGSISGGWYFTDNLALEGALGYADIGGWFEDQTHLDLSVNLLAYMIPDASLSPYIIMGLGYLGTETASGSEENRPSGTLGAGIKWNLGDTRFAIRAEYRARLAWEKDFNFIDQIGSLGVQYSFGSTPEPVADRDMDGVLDFSDRCPDSPPGVIVDAFGCEMDEDRDGVGDSRDLCLGTAYGSVVDEFGCLSDIDQDGVMDNVDLCLRTVEGARVDATGCEIDSDGDTVVDRLDTCPNTKPGARVDQNGCEIQEIISLPGLSFETNSDRLLPGAEQVVADAAATLRRHPDLIIEVAGHTDADGDAEFNRGLSERRANTVRDYLINFGVPPTSLSATGFGEELPIADNATAEGKARNRRVELRILNR
jgi:OOP family OmpA-OmpF porin